MALTRSLSSFRVLVLRPTVRMGPCALVGKRIGVLVVQQTHSFDVCPVPIYAHSISRTTTGRWRRHTRPHLPRLNENVCEGRNERKL